MQARNFLKRIYYSARLASKGVKIARGVVLDRNNKFEGLNNISENAQVTSSEIGMGTYIGRNSKIDKTSIGRYCSLGRNIQTCMGGHPSKVFVSTHPAFFSTAKQAGFSFVSDTIFEEYKYARAIDKKVVKIGNDVWIGNNVIIMDGVTIGDGAIVGAGSIVTKDVEPFAIAVGVPAKTIDYRFSSDQIEKLKKIKWWDLEIGEIKKLVVYYKDIDQFLQKNSIASV